MESFEYLTVIECSIYKSKHGRPYLRKRVEHIFINKETENNREEEKNEPRLYKNVKFACLFTRSDYSTSCIGIRNKSLKTLTETENLNFLN